MRGKGKFISNGITLIKGTKTSNMNKKIYDVERCAKVIGGFLPTKMKTKIGPRQIMVILGAYYEYLTLSAVVENRKHLNLSTADIDPCEAESFIIEKCLEREFVFSLDEVQSVLDGEFQYMCAEGIITINPRHP